LSTYNKKCTTFVCDAPSGGGKKVSVNVKVNYEGTGLRPTSFEIKYNIDGVIKKVRLKN
jgi:hypothetical protein